MSEQKNVLVICQTAACQMYLGILLKRIWYKSILAKTAEEGIQYAEKTRFALIIFDGDIPGTAADRDAAIALLRSDPSVKGIPLVMFITGDRGETYNALIAQGCSAVVTKPLDISFVYSILARLSGQERQTTRIPTRIRVEISDNEGKQYMTCINISEGGLYLRTIDPMPEKTAIHLRFTLPRDTDEIKVTAEVVRTEQLEAEFETEPGMAVRFTDISEEDRKRIRNYIEWELTEDLKWESGI